jgi:hypothetical protein
LLPEKLIICIKQFTYRVVFLTGKQVYLDMLACKGRVKPHILSPAMKMMIDEIKESNTGLETIQEKVWVTQNTKKVPLPPLTAAPAPAVIPIAPAPAPASSDANGKSSILSS